MKESRANSEAFLTIYNELDKYMRVKLDKDLWISHSSLVREMGEHNKLFKRYNDMLCDMARLRNAIIHNPHKRTIDPIAEPHPEIIKLYEGIRDSVLHPALALTALAVPRKDIFTTTMEASAHFVMKTMNKNSYTHVPVIQGSTLVGIFSENTVFSYLVRNQVFAMDKEIQIREFAEFIPLDNHESEYFEFVPKGATVVDVEELFIEDIKNRKRLSAVFVTETGLAGEEILGLITPWDLAKDNIL